MGRKTENLKQLLEQGLNVHAFQEIKTEEELEIYLEKHPICSIRFDRMNEMEDLPFYVVDEKEPLTKEKLKKMIQEATQMHCTLLVSDGHVYDTIQSCNFVGLLKEDDSFLLEVSTEKVPLRHMYDYPTTTIKGSLLERFYQYKIDGAPLTLTKQQVDQILIFFMRLNMRGFYLEGTLYPEPVGVLKEPIVIWQTREEEK